MSATEDRTKHDVAEQLAAWHAAQDATASRAYPPLSNSTTTALMLAQIAIGRETGAAVEPGSPIYEALASLARTAFNEGHDLTRDVERGANAAQRREVEAAMHHASGRASQAFDTITGLIASATAIKLTTPREFARIMKELRHHIWQYAEARARHAHLYHCFYQPGDPLRWEDHDQRREEEERARQRKEAEKRLRGARRK